MNELWLRRSAAICGVVIVLGNLLGVVVLAGIPQAYKPGRMQEWVLDMLAHASGASWSAVLFTVGVLAIVPLAYVLLRAFAPPEAVGARAAGGVVGALFLALAGIMNGSATLAPFVVIHHMVPALGGDSAVANPGFRAAAAALLGWTLMMDALFNALLGLGLFLLGLAMWRDPRFGRFAGGLGVVAGLTALPVMFQSVSYAAAQWLVVAGPLWLIWFLWISWVLWRRPAA